MTADAPSFYADLRKVREEAARLDFVRSMLSVIGIIPIVLGFTARVLWMAPAFLWVSVMWGWRRADSAIKSAHERVGG